MKRIAVLLFLTINLHQSQNQFVSCINIENSRPNPLRWNHKPNELEDAFERIQIKIEGVINMVAAQRTSPRSFSDTFMPLSLLEAEANVVQSNIEFYRQVSTDKDLRKKSQELESKFQVLWRDINLREDYYKALKVGKDDIKRSGEWQTLSSEEKRYVNKNIKILERSGLKLKPEARAQFKQLSKEIDDLSQKADQNILDDNTSIELSVDELKGVSQKRLKSFKKVQGKPGFYQVKMDKVTLFAIGDKLQNEVGRQKVFKAFNSKLVDKNIALLEQVIQKRDQLSKIQGFSSFSDYILIDNMAKNGKTVQAFLQKLIKKGLKKAYSEFNTLQQLKREQTKNASAVLESWDSGYFRKEYVKKKLDFSEEQLKEYYPLNHVVQTTLDIYQELLNLQFTELFDFESWHQEVRLFQVKDLDNEQIIGQFYLDLHPRPNKYNHAAVFGLVQRSEIGGKLQLPVCAMVVNFEKGTKDQESLMYHRNVRTFFHEFGHVMHQLNTKVKLAMFSGTAVERDFVEMPSQMLENWIYDKEITKRLSKHYKTGQPIPDELFQKKLDSRKLTQGLDIMGQLTMATFDLLVHTASDPKKVIAGQKAPQLAQAEKIWKNPDDFNFDSLRQKIKFSKNGLINTKELSDSLFEILQFSHLPESVNRFAQFGHIFSGYQSQYYGYLWSKVYAADLFTKFKSAGLLSKDIGRRYKKHILAPGGTRDSFKSLKAFLEREPNEEPFLQNAGLI